MTRFYQTLILCGSLAAISWWGISKLNSEAPEPMADNQTSILLEEEGEENERINAEERWKAEFEILKNPVTGKIPAGIHLKSVEAALRVPAFHLKDEEGGSDRAIPTITITSRGPNNYGGRTRALGFDVRNNNIVIGGGVTSGIYRSTDGGGSWTRVTPAGVIHSMNCVAQDTRSGQEDTWYAGTGEAGSSAGATGASYLGFGIYKSTDNGLTWSALTNTQGSLESYDSDFDNVSRIVVDPTNGNVLAGATNTVQRSTDGGTNWAKVLGPGNALFRTDLIYNTISSKFYAAIDGQSADAGVWESTTGASGTWTQIRTEAQLGGSIELGRIILANVANTDDIVVMYQMLTDFMCGNGNTTKAGLQHYDGTSTWTNHTNKVGNCTTQYTAGSNLPTQLELQQGYNMALTTKPNDANIVFLAGTEGYRYNLSTDAYEFIGGSQAAANTVNLHVDQHIFLFEPGSNDLMWAGNDGGLRKTDVTGPIKAIVGDPDNGYVWTARVTDYNGYQYYGVDIAPSNSTDFVAGGAQDNAFTIQPTGAAALELGPTADGVDVGIISGGTDFNTHNFFMMWQQGSMFRFQNGAQASNILNPAGTGFVGHFYLDADNTNYMYYPGINNPGNTLYRTRIAETINDQAVTGDATSGWEDMTGVTGAISNPISAMDASRDVQYGGNYSSSNVGRKLYIGTAGGKVFRLGDPAFVSAGTAPTDITPTGMSGGGYVSDIAVNPTDDKEILVTYSNYGVNSVWHTSDASVGSPTWTNVEGPAMSAVELASSRCAMIVIDNGTPVYMVGTSTGLYATDALSGATTSWTRLGTTADLGLAVCIEMRLRTSDNKVALGTHGNGIFLLEFPNPLPIELTSFVGEATDRGNQLRWTTANELDNKGFDIEKLIGGNFEKIGFVEGNGNSSDSQSYDYMDYSIRPGVTFYRLKQIDLNGQFDYSKIVSINNEDAIQTVTLYPNPVKDVLTIENGEGSVTIYNVAGQLVKEEVSVSDFRHQINVSDLPKGMYSLTVSKQNREIESHKFIKTE